MIIRLTPHQIDFVERYSTNLKNKHPELRKGQSFYNSLYKFHSDVADQIINTELDMYYKDENIQKFKDSLYESD